MSRSESQTRKGILLGQLASNGDCLYATAIARQIKVDYPGCHLTWAIASAYRSMLKGNPDVDAVWEITDYGGPGDYEGWWHFKAKAQERKERGEFDEIFLTQIYPDNLQFWAGPVRAAIFRSYPRPITVDTDPVVRLDAEEIDNVRRFAESHQLARKPEVILFECAPRSEQSSVTPQFALDVAHTISAAHPDVAIILSSNHTFASTNENVIDGSALSIRENAELTKYCSLLIGASSGITWISTSDWAKSLPMIQLVRPDVTLSNSLVYDFKKRGVDTARVIEMSSYSGQDVFECVHTIFTQNFQIAKERFEQVTPLRFKHYQHTQYYFLLRGMFGRAFVFLKENIKEHGRPGQFVGFFVLVLLKCLVLMPPKTLLKLKRFVSRSG
ncbi:hypothetical protein IAD21_02701 [Abditibacteriota bacterium]|nr:hypothetical protein IAD21_02701 [Abditibacteriota bacterium]